MKRYFWKTLWYVHIRRARCVDCHHIMLPEDFPWEEVRCIPCIERDIERRYEAQMQWKKLTQ